MMLFACRASSQEIAIDFSDGLYRVQIELEGETVDAIVDTDGNTVAHQEPVYRVHQEGYLYRDGLAWNIPGYGMWLVVWITGEDRPAA